MAGIAGIQLYTAYFLHIPVKLKQCLRGILAPCPKTKLLIVIADGSVGPAGVNEAAEYEIQAEFTDFKL